MISKKISAFLFIVFLLSCIGTSTAQEVIIGEDDDYVKEGIIGESVSFYWTVYLNETNEYAVSVITEVENDWDHQVIPSRFVLTPNNPYQIVEVNLSIPRFSTVEQNQITMFFSFRQLNQTSSFVRTKTAQVNISSAFGAEEKVVFGFLDNPLPAPFNNIYGAFLFNVIFWFLLSILVYVVIKYILGFIARKTKTKLDDAVIDIIRKPVIVLILLYGIISSVIQLGISVGYGDQLFQIYYIIALVIIVYITYKIFEELLDEIALKRGGDQSTFGKVVRPVLRKVGAIVIVIGGLIAGLSMLNVEITPLLAGAGVFGLVIAFAAQDTLSNFFSGMHLLLDRPFHMGDMIILESGEYCRVESVGMRSTKLYSLFEHELIVLPNNTVANQKIVNIVRPDIKIRNKIEVGVAYGSDTQKVMDIIYEVTTSQSDVLTDEGYEPLVRFIDFSDSSLKFMVIFWVDDVMKQWKVMSDIRQEIDSRFKKAGITIPFPQRTVWLHQMDEEKKKTKQNNSQTDSTASNTAKKKQNK